MYCKLRSYTDLNITNYRTNDWRNFQNNMGCKGQLIYETKQYLDKLIQEWHPEETLIRSPDVVVSTRKMSQIPKFQACLLRLLNDPNVQNICLKIVKNGKRIRGLRFLLYIRRDVKCVQNTYSKIRRYHGLSVTNYRANDAL